MARLKDKYRSELAPHLKEELGLANVMEVPRVTKITLNMGIGEALGDKKILEHAVAEIEKITGQKAVITRLVSPLLVSRFARVGRLVCKVTLRRDRMYEFLDRLLHRPAADSRLPRHEPKSFDGRGNFAWA